MQVRVSKHVSHFKDNLMKTWGLSEYEDIELPCLFFGVYDLEDVGSVINHKGEKVVWFTNKYSLEILNLLKQTNDIYFKWQKGLPDWCKSKKINIPIQDYSIFKPFELGDKMYCYIGNDNKSLKHGYPIVKELEKETGVEVIYGVLGNNMDYVIENYYKQCFLNLNITKSGMSGHTTMFELAHIGVNSITNSLVDLPFGLRFQTMDDVIEIINTEKSKIGTVQDNLMPEYFTKSDDWTNINFWKQ